MKDSSQDLLDQRIDSALSRLPQWQPPVDFAPRLAAEAARRAQRPAVSPTLVQAGSLLLHLSHSILMVLATLTAAAVLTWVIPWSAVIDAVDVVAWTSAIVFAATGLWMTQRTLESR
jgi:hypothetical protein